MNSGRKPTDLDRLTTPGGKTLPDDASIPVLTERLTLPKLELDVSLPPSKGAGAPASAAPPAQTEPPPLPAPSPAEDAVDWSAIERDARDALLRELQPRLAAEIDRQLRERLQPTLVRMLLATVTELRPSIESAVREAVAQAVAAEIARRRTAR